MPSLHLYRFIEDAWAGGLLAWCARSSEGESWILVENGGHRRWLLRKLAQAGIDGIRIFDADGLRDEWARLAGAEPLPRNPATAAFAVKVAARQTEAARDADALAEACDVLARAGWHLNQLGLDLALSRRIHRTLDRTAVLPGIFHRRLIDALPAQAVRICCVGWDATHWPDLGLLDVAASKAGAFEMFVPSPRLPADAQQREWIEALEQRFALDRVTCPESGFVSENEPLVARLENSELASRAEVRAPVLLVGREWPDQVRLVCGQVAAWLVENPVQEAPIGVIATEDSPAAVAVAAALEAAGIRVEHPGRAREPAPALLIIEQAARYHSSGQDVAELLELARLLWLHARETWEALDPECVQDSLDRAFQSAQSRNARILARAQPWRKDREWAAVCQLIEALGRWEGDFDWPALRGKWEAMLSALRLPADALDPGPSGLFHSERIPARAFMEWVADEVAAIRRATDPPDHSAQAPVVVTTFAQAAQQTWERLIFLDSNEQVWPAPIGENPFLPDAARSRLNRDRNQCARLLTTWDLRALDQARFLDLIEHCRGSIAFAGVLIEQTDAGDRAQPNEWVLRSLIETAPDCRPARSLGRRRAGMPAGSAAGAGYGGAGAPRDACMARASTATIPFDRYQFNFHETKLEPGAWSATDLDDAITCPATFALGELFRRGINGRLDPVREGRGRGRETGHTVAGAHPGLAIARAAQFRAMMTS